MPSVSVIVPMYNAQRFLPTCLAVMEAAKDADPHFIVVDDHSTDATADILATASDRIGHLTVIRNEENLGVARSRNIALDHVDTQYLTYLDVDDWYAPGHLKAMVESIERLGVDFVRTDHVRTDGLRRVLERAPESRRDQPYPAAEGIGAAGSRAVVDYPFLWAGIYDVTRIDRELLLFDETLRTAADRPWFWRLHMNAHDTAVVDLHGYFYRKDHNPTALTQQGNAQTLHFLDATARTRDLVLPTANEAWITKAAYAAARICAFHVQKQARLTPELRRELAHRSGELLASFPDDLMDRGIRALGRNQRTIATRLVKAGRSA